MICVKWYFVALLCVFLMMGELAYPFTFIGHLAALLCDCLFGYFACSMFLSTCDPSLLSMWTILCQTKKHNTTKSHHLYKAYLGK